MLLFFSALSEIKIIKLLIKKNINIDYIYNVIEVFENNSLKEEGRLVGEHYDYVYNLLENCDARRIAKYFKLFHEYMLKH